MIRKMKRAALRAAVVVAPVVGAVSAHAQSTGITSAFDVTTMLSPTTAIVATIATGVAGITVFKYGAKLWRKIWAWLS